MEQQRKPPVPKKSNSKTRSFVVKMGEEGCVTTRSQMLSVGEEALIVNDSRLVKQMKKNADHWKS